MSEEIFKIKRKTIFDYLVLVVWALIFLTGLITMNAGFELSTTTMEKLFSVAIYGIFLIGASITAFWLNFYGRESK